MKKRYRKKIKKQISKQSRSSFSLSKKLKKFFSKQPKSSRYQSILKTTAPKTTAKKSARKTKYQSILKTTAPKTTAKKPIPKSKYKKVLKQTKEEKRIIKKIEAGDLRGLAREDYLDDKVLRNLKRKKDVELNTAQFKADLQTFKKQPLRSSWIDSGTWEFEEKDGVWTLTITIHNRLAAGWKQSYTYTYIVKDKKVWEEMKAARGAYGKGAGTVFWKYFKRGVIVQDKSLVK